MLTTPTTIDLERQMLGEVEMVGRERWEEIHRRASSGSSVRAIARGLDLDRKTCDGAHTHASPHFASIRSRRKLRWSRLCGAPHSRDHLTSRWRRSTERLPPWRFSPTSGFLQGQVFVLHTRRAASLPLKSPIKTLARPATATRSGTAARCSGASETATGNRLGREYR